MGRAPETSDYFKLIINRLSPEQLGVVIADLAKREIFDIRPELITDVATYKRKGENGESTDLVTAWSLEHPTFQAIEVCRYFESIGRTRGSAYSALTKLVESGVLVKRGSGLYARADVKAIEPPKKKAVTKAIEKIARKGGPQKHFAKPGEDVVLSYGRRNHGRVNTAKLIEVFKAEGRARNSVYASIDALMKKKLVKRVGDKGSGQYVLLAKAVPAKKKPVTKVNGSIPASTLVNAVKSVVEASDHG